ncbi:unnamed protein product [Closterium sp. NIES-53]
MGPYEALNGATLLWHHRLGHPSLPRLRGMASRALVSGLPRSLPPLPPGPAPTCVPCVEGRQRAAPHSSPFPPTEAPVQTLHMDVWGLARVRGQGHERYFLLVVDDYSRYTTVFHLRSKAEVLERRIGMVMDIARTSMLHAAAPHFLWPFAVQYTEHQINLQPRVSLPETTPTLRWTGKVGDASEFRVWGSRAFVRYTAANKLSSSAVPCIFLRFPPDAPGWQFCHPASRRVLSSQDVTFDESVSYYRLFPYRTASLPPPPLFLAPGTPPVDPLSPQGPAPSGVSQVDPAEPVEVAVDSGAATGGAETGGAGPGGAERGRVETGGAETGGAESGGTEPVRAESGGALGVPSRREPLSPQQLREWYSRRCRGAAGACAAGAAAAGAAGGAVGAGTAGGAAGAGAAEGAAGAGGAAGASGGAAGAGAAGGAAGAGGATGAGAAGAAGGATGTGDPGAEGPGSVSAVSRDAARPRPYYVPLLQQVLGLPPPPGPPPPLPSPQPVQSQPSLQPASPLPCPSPYSGPTRGLTECREPESHPVSPSSRSASPVHPVRTGRVSRPRPPPVPGTHSMTLRPSTAPQQVPLPSPLASSLPDGPDPESGSLRAASPTVTRFLATAVIDPLFESSAVSALVAELVEFATACRLDYATSFVAKSVSACVCPPSVGGECALGTDVLEDRQEEFECFAASVPHLVSMLLAPEGDPDAPDIPTPRSYAEAIEGPYSSQWQAAMDAEMASWKSTGTYGKAAAGFSACLQGAVRCTWLQSATGSRLLPDLLHTPKMTTLRVLLHVAVLRDYELHSLDFSTAFLQGSLYEETWLRRPPGFTGSFPAGTQWSLRRPVYGLPQTPREWHDTVRTTLAALGFAPSTSDPSLFLRNDTMLPLFYVLVYVGDLVFPTAGTEALAHVKSELQKRHTCTDLDESVEPSGPYPELVGCLMHRKVHWDAVKRVLRYLCSTSGMGLVLGGRARVVLTGHADASWVDDLATQRSSLGYTFSHGSGSVSWRSTRSSSVLSSSCEAEIYVGAMAAQELRWLTYLLTDLGEAPRSPPVLYVDNKAMLALCQEHRLEHRTKHIALRFFLAQELQQRGQLRLAYVASLANTANLALPS